MTTPLPPVGIDAYAVHIPRLYVDLTGAWATDRANARGEDREAFVGKMTRGLGVRRMAVPDAHEDSATLAAMAAKKLIDATGIDPADVGYLAVGTETTVDQSKSLAAYVLGMLEKAYGRDLGDVACPQFQFACMGGTYALEAAANHVACAGGGEKPYAIVIATDVSKYALGSSGEYTQGAGAVAMLIARNPRLLALEPMAATVTRDERDFFRPNFRAEAVVDGKYSIDVYLDCIARAFDRYRARFEAREGRPFTERDAHAYLFHVPFPRMAEYAASRVLRRLEAKPDAPELEAGEARRKADRVVASSPAFKALFEAKVAPSLTLPSEVGNTYSAALYLALASFCERAVASDGELEGKRVVFCSYGSGASARVFSARFGVGVRGAVERALVGPALRDVADGGTRVALDVARYERLHGLRDEALSLPRGLLERLGDGGTLTADEARVLHAALAKPTFVPRPRPASVRPPLDEFALVAFGAGTGDGASRDDLGYRYYDFVRSGARVTPR
jgi:hydroxymethylglutaryl-CoA synthase